MVKTSTKQNSKTKLSKLPGGAMAITVTAFKKYFVSSRQAPVAESFIYKIARL